MRAELCQVPVVLTRGEVEQLLAHLDDVVLLVCTLLYGSGLQLLECLHMRVKDIDFERSEIVVRDGKEQKDRVAMLPASSTICRRSANSMKTTCAWAWAARLCRTPFPASTRVRTGCGPGNTSSRRPPTTLIA